MWGTEGRSPEIRRHSCVRVPERISDDAHHSWHTRPGRGGLNSVAPVDRRGVCETSAKSAEEKALYRSAGAASFTDCKVVETKLRLVDSGPHVHAEPSEEWVD